MVQVTWNTFTPNLDDDIEFDLKKKARGIRFNC